MTLGRREFVTAAGVVVTSALLPIGVAADTRMHGLIGKMLVTPGKREDLIKILLEDVSEMPGCLSYIVGRDPKDENAVWITEVWDSKESHQASLKLASVRAAIAKARPIIAGFGESFTTEPIGGFGLAKPKR